MKSYKRILASFLVTVNLVLFVLSPAASANFANDYLDSYFAQWAVHGTVTALSMVAAAGVDVVIPGFGLVAGSKVAAVLSQGINLGIDEIMRLLAEDESFVPYDDYVSDLPVNGVGSSGKLYWHPSYLDLSPRNSSSLLSASSGSYSFSFPLGQSVPGSYTDGYSFLTVSEDTIGIMGRTGYQRSYFTVYLDFIAPIDGLYQIFSGTPAFSGTVTNDSTGVVYDASSFYSSSSYSKYSGDILSLSCNSKTISGEQYLTAVLSLVYPTYVITPLSSIDTSTSASGTTYNINTRPTSITGDYGIIGDNNQMTVIENQTIVNEGDSYYFNPVTNTTYDMTGWQYDYSTRTYNLTLDSGDTVTVNYGDENITINEGGTTYNVYYVIPSEESGSEQGGEQGGDTPVASGHNWQVTEQVEGYTDYSAAVYVSDDSVVAASITSQQDPLAALVAATSFSSVASSEFSFSCDGEAIRFTPSLDALSHAPGEVVAGFYDGDTQDTCSAAYSDGAYTMEYLGAGDYYLTLIDADDYTSPNYIYKLSVGSGEYVQGYTVYTCSKCNETYTEYEDGTIVGEPDSACSGVHLSGGLFEALGDFLADGIHWIADKLTQLVNSFSGISDIFSGFAETVSENAGEYPQFFQQVVAIMPDDLMNVLWFAIIGAVAVAAWRKWFG